MPYRHLKMLRHGQKWGLYICTIYLHQVGSSLCLVLKTSITIFFKNWLIILFHKIEPYLAYVFSFWKVGYGKYVHFQKLGIDSYQPVHIIIISIISKRSLSTHLILMGVIPSRKCSNKAPKYLNEETCLF